MKKLFFPIVLLTSFFSFSQSTNLDKEYFNYSVIDLPTQPISNPDDRTFSVNDNYISIAGFSRVSTDGTIAIDFMFNGTTVENFEVVEVKHEKKNKKGEVISTKFSYKLELDYKSTGAVRITNMLTGENYSDTYSHSSSYTKHSFKTRSKAQHYYDNNRHSLETKYRNDHMRDMEESIQDYLNRTYGYPINSGKDYLEILSKKSHPEYYKHQEAFEKVRLAFVKMSYNKPIISLEKELQSVMTYFKEVIPRYQGKNKKMRKLRYASYYNLAKMYYYLDNIEKTKEFGQKIIDNGYNKRKGRSFIKKADRLQDLLYANGVDTRHLANSTRNQDNQESENNEESHSDEDNTTDDDTNEIRPLQYN